MDLVVSKLEMEWVLTSLERGAPMSLCITKHHVDGTKAELLLSEAETTILSQLITTRKDKATCAMSTPSSEDTGGKPSSMEPPSSAMPLERSGSNSQ